MKYSAVRERDIVSMKPQHKILIVDDNRYFREIVRTILEREPFFYKVWEASSVIQATYLLDTLLLDVVLLDARLAGQESGLDVAAYVTKANIKVKLLGITTYEGAANLLHMVKAGMRGILLKTKTGPHELGEAIQTVIRGEQYFPSQVKKIMDENSDSLDELPLVRLTEKEKEYLKSIENGLNEKDIAKKLKASIISIHTMSKTLHEKTGTHSASALVAYAYRNGLLP